MIINILFLIISYAVHEGGHALCALSLKKKITRITLFSVHLKDFNQIPKHQVRLIAICGPLATLLFALIMSLTSFQNIAYLNFFLCFINLLPLPGADGYKIFKN